MPDALAVSNLRAGYDRSVVLQGVSLTVPAGRNVAIVGPNGAGKSTFLKVMSGIVRPSGGSILVNGSNASDWSSERTVASGIIHVPEGRQVFPGLSVAENLWLGGYSKPDRREELLEGVLELFPRLKERMKQAADSLSGGEQQMLAIGRGLMAEPVVLMLDEPTLGLAPVVIDLMTEALIRLRARSNLSLLVVEQNVQLTRGLCDDAYILVDGRIVMSGPTDELIGNDMMKIYLGSS
jgi:branched-chain amino acid transport system ATP-binding protein